MIRINFPDNYAPERKYIVNILFDEFLGLKYDINVKGGAKDYDIILENGKKIIIKDSFFSNFEDGLDYLDKKYLPEKINILKNQFIVEKDIPVIYGDDEFKIEENEIVCGIDIFASSFFMLTRWEEYVNKNRDIHNRFPGTASLAYKYNYLDRPIVNEYVEMLWNMLKCLGCNQKRKDKKHELVLTHDVDTIFKWKSFGLFTRNIAGDIIKRKNISLAFENVRNYFVNPYNTFDYLMDKSESIGIKSRFYFMSGGITKYDNNYKIDEKKCIELVKEIRKRGHIIGFHGSYASYNNPQQWEKEEELLERVCQSEVNEGRQHFLRFEVPKTWQIWEDNNMNWDSTLTYPEKEGFRCGTCYEYSVFNILTRKRLRLKERPLIVMDGSLVTYQNLSPEKAEKKIIKLIEKVKKYNGSFVLLWHNSSFNNDLWTGYQEVYEKIVSNTP